MMKKVYEKPELNIVSYASNSALCSGCDINDPDIIYSFFPDMEEIPGTFAMGEACENMVPTDQYCKFTVNGAIKIFTS